MKRTWESEELIEHFRLNQEETTWLSNRSASNQIGAAILFKCFQYLGRFPSSKEVPQAIITFISQQLSISPEYYEAYNLESRRAFYDSATIREQLGFRETRVEDYEGLIEWLMRPELMYQSHETADLKEESYQYLRDQKLEPPTSGQIKRIISTALNRFEISFFDETLQALSASSKLALDEWLYTGEEADIVPSPN